MGYRARFLGAVGAAILAGILSSHSIRAKATNYSNVTSLEYKIDSLSTPISTANVPGLSRYNARELDIEIPNGLRINALSTDDPNTPKKPDNIQVTVYRKKNGEWLLQELFSDSQLNGIEPYTESPDSVFVEPDYYREMNETGSHPKKTLSALSPKDIEQVNRRLEACLHELSVYAKNREGRIKRPTPGDPGSQYLEEMPNHGIINWVECLPGMYTTSMDVVFHNELVDRIELVRIDPENYAFSVHNDLNMRTIEQWREDLDAVAVINGSYYASSPYGLPITPTVNEGERLDRKKGYESNNGAFFAEPTKPKNPKAKIVSFRTSISADDIIENEGYRTVVFSYPILTDTYGRNRSVDDPQKRATRTFIAQDKQGNIILGNTQGGFFSQRRLGNFLREAYDLDMVTALCMDGGPPACMAVKAGNRSYTNYGQWESVPYNGQEIMAWNDRNSGRWKIPIVIAVKPRN